MEKVNTDARAALEMAELGFGPVVGRPSDRTFFIYDHSVVQQEEDDPKDAIIYFYPHSLSIDGRCLLCGQLMGMVNLMQTIAGSSPRLYRLKKLKFATKHEGNFTLALACKQRTPDDAVQEKLNHLYAVFAFYHGSIQKVLQECGNQREDFLKRMDAIWDCYLPFIRRYGNTVPGMFEPIPRVRLPKTGNLIFLRCSHILQWLKSNSQLLGGCILYKNSVLCSQLTSHLTSHLLLIKPNQSHLPSNMVTVGYSLPYGVRLMSVYLTETEHRLFVKQTDKSSKRIPTNKLKKKSVDQSEDTTFQKNCQSSPEVANPTCAKVTHIPNENESSAINLAPNTLDPNKCVETSKNIVRNGAVIARDVRTQDDFEASQNEQTNNDGRMRYDTCELAVNIGQNVLGGGSRSKLDNSDTNDESITRDELTDDRGCSICNVLTNCEHQKPNCVEVRLDKVEKLEGDQVEHGVDVSKEVNSEKDLEVESEEVDGCHNTQNDQNDTGVTSEEQVIEDSTPIRDDVTNNPVANHDDVAQSSHDDKICHDDDDISGHVDKFPHSVEESHGSESSHVESSHDVSESCHDDNDESCLNGNHDNGANNSCKDANCSDDLKSDQDDQDNSTELHNNSDTPHDAHVTEHNDTKVADANMAELIENASEQIQELELNDIKSIIQSENEDLPLKTDHEMAISMPNGIDTNTEEVDNTVSSEDSSIKDKALVEFDLSTSGEVNSTGSTDETLPVQIDVQEGDTGTSLESASEKSSAQIGPSEDSSVKDKSPVEFDLSTSGEVTSASSTGETLLVQIDAHESDGRTSLELTSEPSAQNGQYSDSETNVTRLPMDGEGDHKFASPEQLSPMKRVDEKGDAKSFGHGRRIGNAAVNQVSGMVNVSLYVQAHSDMVLVFLAENSFVQDKSALYNVWRSVLTELGELEPILKQCAYHSTSMGDSIYNFIQYDQFDKLLQSSLENPVTPMQSEFCRASDMLHHQFTKDDSITDVLVRNHRSAVCAHQNASHQVFAQNKHYPPNSSGIPQRDDMAFFLDAPAQKLLYRDHGINLI
ncbi:uncharacterized protein [Amphiura filiformis]|uniref:uncharacterized protein n=1 Tax=Amphiura filiformis TaxID=82378 RepID=UPI003B219768